MTNGARDAHLSDRGQDEVLGGHPEPKLAAVANPHRLGLRLDEALCREHVLDLAGADAERERTERAVRRRVRVAAHDRHARLGDAELGADHVDDALVFGAEGVDRNPELLAVAFKCLHLDAAELVLDPRGDGRAVGRHVVVRGGERAVGTTDGPMRQAKAIERLRTRHLVHEMQVDVQQAGRDLVSAPDLVEQALRHGCVLGLG